MGINLSDYIGFVLTKEMLGQNDPKESEEYKELLQKQRHLQIELAKYHVIAEQYKDFVGKDIFINGKTHRFEHVTEVIANILSNFKIKN